MLPNRAQLAALTLTLSATLAGCGGGSSDGSQDNGTQPPLSADTAEGVYGGTLAGSASTDFQGLILENGDFWSLYGSDMDSIFYVDGFVQGNGNSSNGSFVAADIADFGVFPVIHGSVDSSFNASAGTITGTIDYDEFGEVDFNGGPIAASTYNYDTPASLSDISGNWTTMSSLGGTVLVSINSNGSIAVNEDGCTGTGTIEPRASGKNVFNVSITFGGAPCLLPNQTATGIGIVYPLSTGQEQMIAAVVNANRTGGVAVFGVR